MRMEKDLEKREIANLLRLRLQSNRSTIGKHDEAKLATPKEERHKMIHEETEKQERKTLLDRNL